jgi:hypothetical protein
MPPRPGAVAIAAMMSLGGFGGRPAIIRLICHCWAMDRVLLTTQYSTRPAGNHRNMKVKRMGIIIITLAWIGIRRRRVELHLDELVAPMISGRM